MPPAGAAVEKLGKVIVPSVDADADIMKEQKWCIPLMLMLW